MSQHFTYSQVQAACMTKDIFDDQSMIDLAKHPGRYFLHNSLRSHREAIRTQGLIPHKPFVDGNWPSMKNDPAFVHMKGPKGIYVFPLGNTPEVNEPFYVGCQYGGDDSFRIPGHEDEPMDHWLIDGAGLRVKPDPDYDYACIITTVVSPARLKLLTDLIDESAPKPKRGHDDGLIDSLFSTLPMFGLDEQPRRYEDDEYDSHADEYGDDHYYDY